MDTLQIHRAWVEKALHPRKAHFLRMDEPRVTANPPPKDQKPLQRSLKRLQDPEVYGNEAMCTALWELMARN